MVAGEKRIKVWREGEFLYLMKDGELRSVRFSLRTKQMYKQDSQKRLLDGEPTKWESVLHQHHYFQGYAIHQIDFAENKFKELMSYARRMSEGRKSISTFLTNLGKALVFESYIDQGLRFEFLVQGSYWGDAPTVHCITRELQQYDKNVIKFFKKHNLQFNTEWENFYFRGEGFTRMDKGQIISLLHKLDQKYSSEDIRRMYDAFTTNNSPADNFSILVSHYKCDAFSLWCYLFDYIEPFENIKFPESVRLLNDYCRMAHGIGRSIKKYPKYLKSMHDILAANYQANQQIYDEMKFSSMAKKHLEHEGQKFTVVVPLSSKDIIKEGASLNHCVASYVNKVLKEETYIMFMRYKETRDESLITLELQNGCIVQAKGSYNRALTDEEKKFLVTYCKQKNLQNKVVHETFAMEAQEMPPIEARA